MTRLPLAAGLAAGLLWAATGPARAQDTKAPGVSPQTQKINELIAKGWEAGGVKMAAGLSTPTAKASDHEFMRRVFIDLIGRIPTPEEITDFEMDKAPNKRAKLVFRLLNETKYTLKDKNGKPVTALAGLKVTKGEIDYNNAYAENFADLWTTWMLTRSNTLPLYRDQFHIWLTQQFAKGKAWNTIVSDLISATGKGNNNGAVIFTIRHLGDPIAAEMGMKPDFIRDGRYDAVPITSRVTKLFLGIQSQCVQCHDHPFNKEYIQSDFWGVNAFYRQTERSGTTNPRNLGQGITPPQLELSDVSNWNTPGLVLYERRDGQRKAAFPAMLRDLEQFSKGEPTAKRLVASSGQPDALTGKTRRQILAQWVTEHDNFARAYVNRMWGHLFGRGLNKEPAVDDFSSNNEVVHPELLDYLAEEFKKYNYDPKKLLEWICTSDVYQLSHVANKANADPKFDPFFGRMPLKAMSPEVMFDSLATATRAETRRGDYEGYKTFKNAWIQKLTQNFGDDEGNEINFNGTVVQALLMMNGKEINGEISSGAAPGPKGPKGGTAGDGAVADVVKRHAHAGGGGPAAIYDDLFLMTVSRHPTKEEIAKLEDVRMGKARIDLGPAQPPKGPANPPGGVKPPPKGPQVFVPGAAPDDVAFYQDVFWALLNSNEFMLNH